MQMPGTYRYIFASEEGEGARMKRILSVIIIVCMVTGMIAYPAGMEKVSAAVSGDYEYGNSADGTAVYISKYNGTASEIEIPANIDGKTVRDISSIAFTRCKSLKSVVVPDTVTSIQSGAFAECTNLEKITLPDGISEIGGITFSKCSSLKEISLPVSLEAIEHSLFNGCTSLFKVTIPVSVISIANSAFYKCGNLQEVYYSGTQKQWKEINVEIGNEVLLNAVIHCSDGILSDNTGSEYEYADLDDGTIEITKYNGTSTEAEIPAQIDGKQVTGIGEGAFMELEHLTKISIPDGVVYIGVRAFSDCTGLTEVRIPDGLERLEESAFSYCTGLTQITLPDSLKKIGRLAFRGCKNLAEISIPESVNVMEDGAFMFCGSLKEIIIPDGVERLGAILFSECSSLTNIHIPESVTVLGNGVFESCSSLESIHIPVSVINIEQYAFRQCSNLTDVYYNGTKEQWSAITIDAASGLEDEKITIHFIGEDESAKDYEYRVLEDGTVEITKYTGSDESVTVPYELDGKNVTKIGKNAFSNNENLKKVILPACLTEMDDSFSGCLNLAAFDVDFASESFSVEDGVLFNKEKTEIVRCPEGKSGGYSVPAGVILVRDSAFSGCGQLEMISVPDGVAKIGNGVFRECTAVTEVILPESVNEIGISAFELCSSLKNIHIPSGIKELKSWTFSRCSSLTEVQIPEGVTWINTGAFQYCEKLKSITIPVSTVKISSGAFSVGLIRPSKIEDVYYCGTKEQWEQIEVPGRDEGSVREKLFLNAAIHFKNSPIVLPEEPIQPEVRNPKEELERLKSADPFSLEKDFSHYLSAEQMDILQSYLFTWLAEVNYAYQYSGSSEVKELVMKKAGIDPQGDFASGMEQAITHVSVKTPFGMKTFEITMGLGKPDGSGNLYPGYGVMHYEVLEKGGIPSDVPESGQIVRNYYTDMGPFVESVKKAAGDSLHGTYQWEKLEDAVTAGILVDKNVAEIVGNKNGSFSDGTFTIFAEPLFAYSKIVRIACPVDVHVYGMDGKEAGSIVNNQPSGGSRNVRLDVDGDTKTVYLAGDDYYLNLRGTGTGTMKYEVEEIANEDVQRTVQFLELQLKQDMQYEGYVFRPLNIDRDMYALRTKGSGGQEVIYPDSDTYEASFKKVQQLSLSQKNTALESDRTVQLSASHLPLDASNPNLRWMTDNESVARVDGNGLVTAVGSGRATVTVTTKDGSFLRQFCVIDVAGGSTDNDSDGNGGGNTGGSNGGTGGDGPGSGGGSGNTGGSGGTGGSGSGGSGTSGGTGQKPSIVKVHYVLQFDLNGGTKTSRKTMTLLSGDIPGIMPKAQRKDYTFSGWYTKQQGGEKINGDKPLDAAATLYARWAKAAAPAKPASLKLASKKKGQIQAGFQNVNGAAGYQLDYSVNKNFTSAKTKEAKASAKTKTLTGLKAGKKYYVRVRAYSLDSMGNRIYGPYSTVKSVTVKK